MTFSVDQPAPPRREMYWLASDDPAAAPKEELALKVAAFPSTAAWNTPPPEAWPTPWTLAPFLSSGETIS